MNLFCFLEYEFISTKCIEEHNFEINRNYTSVAYHKYLVRVNTHHYVQKQPLTRNYKLYNEKRY